MRTHKWNKRKNKSKESLDKFFKLSNDQWLKIRFTYSKFLSCWIVDIIVANSKRQCNDCLRKSEKSPKKFYGKITGNKLGLEALLIARHELLEFEKSLHNTSIRIYAVTERHFNIYKRGLKNKYIEYRDITNNKRFLERHIY